MLFTGATNFRTLPEVNQLKFSFDNIVIDNATGVASIGFSGIIETPSSGLSGYWKFDEGTGVTTYSSINGFTGTLINNPSWTNSFLNKGVSFNGSNNYVLTNFIPNLNSGFTINSWINSLNPVGDRSIIGDSTNAHLIRTRSSTILDVVLGGFTNGVNAYRDIPLNTTSGKWYMLSVTFNGSGSSGFVSVYQNAALVGASTLTSSNAAWAGGLTVGQRGNNSEYWSGLIDEVRVYNNPLSSGNIQTLYNSYFNKTQFNFSNQKIFNTEGKTIGTFNINEPFSISGFLDTGTYQYFVNGDLISPRSLKNNYTSSNLFVDITGTSFSSDIKLSCSPINYAINVNDSFTALSNLTGSITNNSSTKFKVFSSEIFPFQSNEAMLSGQISGAVSGSNSLGFSLTDLNESRLDSNLKFQLNLNTNIGVLSKEFAVNRVSGMDLLVRTLIGNSGGVVLSGLFDGSGQIPNKFTFINSSESTTQSYYINTSDLRGNAKNSSVSIKLEPVYPSSGSAYRSDYVTGFNLLSSGRYQHIPTPIFTGYYYIDGLDYNLGSILLSSGCSGNVPIIFSGVNGGSGASGYLVSNRVLLNNVYDVGTHSYYIPQSFQMMSGGTGYVQTPVSIVRTGIFANCRDVAAAYGYSNYGFTTFNGNGKLVPSASYMTGIVKYTTGFVSGGLSGTGYFITGLEWTNQGSGFNQTLYPKVVFQRNALDTYTGNASGVMLLKQSGLYDFSFWGVNTGLSSKILTGLNGFSGQINLNPTDNYVSVQVNYSGDNTENLVAKLTISMSGGSSIETLVTGKKYYDITTGFLKKKNNLNPILFQEGSDLSFLLTQDELDNYYSSESFLGNQIPQDGDLEF